MSQVRPHPYFTYAQYVALEMESSTRHEFFDGEIYSMAGGSDEHAALAMRIGWSLINAVGDRPCRVYSSDLRIYVEAARMAAFPDASVVYGPFQRFDLGPETTALNPMILVEVTSGSSEEYDTETKLECYRTIPSLREYVVASHREHRITVHPRDENGNWTSHVAIKGERIALPSLGAELSVDEIYRNSTISAD